MTTQQRRLLRLVQRTRTARKSAKAKLLVAQERTILAERNFNTAATLALNAGVPATSVFDGG